MKASHGFEHDSKVIL